MLGAVFRSAFPATLNAFFEIKFLGIPFTGLRFSLTLAALVIMGLVLETILGRKSVMGWLPPENEEMMKNQAGKIKMYL